MVPVLIWKKPRERLSSSGSDQNGEAERGRGRTRLVRVEVGGRARHVFGQGEDGHAVGDGLFDHLFERVGGVAAELAGVAVVGEWHFL